MLFTYVIGYASGLTQGIYLPLFVFYILAGLIRLAHYNVTEMERKECTEGCREYYEGLPVTSSAVLIPLLFFIVGRFNIAITLVYPVVLLMIGLLFISKVKIKKVDPRKLAIGAFLGAVVAFFVR